jgi:hypothetical protein
MKRSISVAMTKNLFFILLASVVIQTAHAAQLVNSSDDQKVMRAIIITEKYFNEGSRNWKNALGTPIGPLSSQKALGQCGDVQHMLAYALTLQGVSETHLHFYQMTDITYSDDGEGVGHGFLAELAAPHAVLVFDTLDNQSQPIYLFLDATFPQFEDSVNRLNSDPLGKEIVSSIHHNGYWIADPAALAIYAADFKMLTNDGSVAFLGSNHYSIDFSALGRDYPQMTQADRASAISAGHVFGATDTEELTELQSITPTDISSRRLIP